MIRRTARDLTEQERETRRRQMAARSYSMHPRAIPLIDETTSLLSGVPVEPCRQCEGEDCDTCGASGVVVDTTKFLTAADYTRRSDDLAAERERYVVRAEQREERRRQDFAQHEYAAALSRLEKYRQERDAQLERLHRRRSELGAKMIELDREFAGLPFPFGIREQWDWLLRCIDGVDDQIAQS